MNEPTITLTGRLTHDPELRYIGDGKPVATLDIATNPRVKNRQTGEWEDGETMFIQASAWGTLAENATETLSKGSPIIATGRLTIRSYQRKDGSTAHSHDLQIDELGLNLRFTQTPNTSHSSGTSYRGAYTAPTGGSSSDPWATQKGTNNEQAPF